MVPCNLIYILLDLNFLSFVGCFCGVFFSFQRQEAFRSQKLLKSNTRIPVCHKNADRPLLIAQEQSPLCEYKI